MMHDPRIGTLIDGHRIEERLGEGGMGVVYRARHLILNRDVALKLIRPELSHDQAFRQRCRSEMEIAAAIDDEHVVRVANVSITNGSGERLWGPYRVGVNSPKRFNISIRNRTRVTLDQLSLPAGDNPCDGDNIEAYPAWGDLGVSEMRLSSGSPRPRLIREEESSPDLGARGVFFVFAVSSTRYHR